MRLLFATNASLSAYARRQDRELVLVPHHVAQQAATTALLATERIRARTLAKAVAARLAAARENNARWYAVGPLRECEDEAIIAQQLQQADPLADAEGFLLDVPARILESAANNVLCAPPRGDGMVHVDPDLWCHLAIYAPSRNHVAQLEAEPLAA